VGNTVGNRYLNGSPTLPYPSFRSYAGQDVFLDMAFVDHTMTPVIPTTLVYQVDDITNDQNLIPQQTLTPGASTYTLQLPGQGPPGIGLQMAYPYQGTQLCQLSGWIQAIDSVTGTQFTAPFIYIIELAAIATPNGVTFP
jgi:hypothetical protein